MTASRLRPGRVALALALTLAVILLNASLTFGNVWPTPAIRWQPRLSAELAVLLLVLSIAAARGRLPTARGLRLLSIAWVALAMAHYANVTAPALYGRTVNLYWDLPHAANVVAMLAGAAAPWRVALAVAALVLVPVLLYAPARWAIGQVAGAMARAGERRFLAVVAVVILALFAGDRWTRHVDDPSWFAEPVTTTFARQGLLLAQGLSAGSTGRFVPASPVLTSTLERTRGADVLLVFVESYGAVSFDRPGFASSLAAPRAALEAAMHDTGRQVVSAFVDSPTFGGSSWLAHLSLLSGIEVRDADANAIVMMQQRDTAVTLFSRRGYRTVAVMPGLTQAWPEGAFYGFDAVYDRDALAYRGPQFGWWSTPDQFALAQADALELSASNRAPVFLVYPTTATHAPFGPTAPYQPDWARIRTAEPYDEADVARTYLQEPDWLNLSPGYARALAYSYDVFAGYLRYRAARDIVLILIGDHQPPAAVSGEGASWEVPVHVIASRPAVLERLTAGGFTSGILPRRPSLGPMHRLLPRLLDAFGDAGSASVARAR